MDPNLFSLLDPDPGGTFDKKNSAPNGGKKLSPENPSFFLPPAKLGIEPKKIFCSKIQN